MISFSVINEDQFDDWQGSDVLSAKNYNSADEYVKGLEDDVAKGRQLFADRKGADHHMTNPGDSLWSWVPFSDESNAENKIDETEAMIRRIKNEPELFDTYKTGKPAPSFWDSPHKWGHTKNSFADHPLAWTLGAGAVTTAAYLGKKKYDMNKQLQNRNVPVDVNIPGSASENFRRHFVNPASNNI